MLRKKNFENNIYMKMMEMVYFYLKANLLMLGLNLPLFLAVNFLELSIGNALIFFIALIPLGISIGAGFLIIFYREASKAYQFPENLNKQILQLAKKLMGYWLMGLLSLLILLIDIVFFSKTQLFIWLFPGLLVLSVFTMGIMIQGIYFRIIYPNKRNIEILKWSVCLSIKKFYITIINVCLFLLLVITMVIKPQFGFLITPTIFMLLIYRNCTMLKI
ncbi:hypothetical protein M2139_000955 [Enterococcus sp. PF1-24]|uniref:hypothetical protein n=1 Tax=unclassified Enterococcus TaxID=2608891 RepID=UPI0024749387|nr:MULTISPECIES: hypothetical protein [unclassified Enterococcus]MDH6363970.1 hypothetical protein [Enterococcus sp. PFB1-1]MDH6401071.1 hypothetical protein [Enterococcus sp. PF1-24]